MAMSVCCYQETYQGADGPLIDKARHRLGVYLGDENIIGAREGFMPPAISHVRSAPAFIFKLNDEGEQGYRHGIVGIDDFWEYPETASDDADPDADADDAGQLGQTTTGGTPPPTATGTTTRP